MVYTNFLHMQQEISLVAVIVLLLIYDIFGTPKSLKYIQPVACLLVGIHILFNICPTPDVTAFGGMYHNTAMGSVMKPILGIGTLLVFMQANNWLSGERAIIRRGEFYMITLATLLGMYFMISAEAGAKYILTAVFASGLSLYGISLIYGTAGTLYFEDIPAGLNGSPLQLMAFVFFFVGLGFKLSLVPFHQWTPDVYEGAPTSVTAYLSVISKGAAAFVLMTILYKVFAPLVNEWQTILYWVIVASITLANLFAIRQQNLKRFLAYSSISQAGYIMLGVISGTALGMTGLVYYVLVYMLSNLAAFGVIAVVEHRSGKITIDDYNGLYATNPRLSFVMMLALFSLAGIPPFAGFFSKFFIFAAAAQQGYYVLVFIALLNTIISLYYYLRVVKAMFINKSEQPIAPFASDNYTRVSLVICSAGILLVGLLSIVYESIGTHSFGM